MPRRTAAGLAAIALAVLTGACASSAATTPGAAASAAGPAAVGGGPDVAPQIGAPALTVPVAASGAGTASTSAAAAGIAGASAALAYPYYGGMPAVAPSGTIVVSGYGQATMAADGSDRAAAQDRALAAALADARWQADAVARGAGLTITGVYSISASGGGYGYAVPMAATGAAGPISAPQAPVEPGAAPSGAVAPVPIPTDVDFAMSVTVAYAFANAAP